MLIGIDVSRANKVQRTGVEEYSWQIIEHLKQIIPATVGVVLYTDKPLAGKLAELPTNWSEKVLHWPPFGSAQGKPWRLWTQIRLSWEMLVNPPDVLFIPAHVFPLIHPKKTVLTVHDIAAIKFPEGYNWFERWYSVWSAKFAVKRLWKVIVPSNFTKHEITTSLHHHITSKNNIFVVPHGYDKKYEIKYDQNTKKILLKYNLQTPFLLSVGRLEEKKNTVNIIKAFDKLKIVFKISKFQNLKLILVGKSGFGYEKVKQAIENSPYKSEIIQLGWVDEIDLPYLFKAAEVFVFPSLYEGFGLPVLEALASGVPVVASGGSSASLTTASQEVGGEACFYVDPLKVNEIVEGILKILQNSDFRMQNIEKGLERVKGFSWEKCAHQTLEHLIT